MAQWQVASCTKMSKMTEHVQDMQSGQNSFILTLIRRNYCNLVPRVLYYLLRWTSRREPGNEVGIIVRFTPFLVGKNICQFFSLEGISIVFTEALWLKANVTKKNYTSDLSNLSLQFCEQSWENEVSQQIISNLKPLVVMRPRFVVKCLPKTKTRFQILHFTFWKFSNAQFQGHF